MKWICLLVISAISLCAAGQERVNPVIESTGGIFEVPFAEELPDKNIEYKVVIDLQTADDNTNKMSFAINNVARMMNLHAVGGVPEMEVVGVIHYTNTRSVLTDEAYRKRYGVDNPNLQAIRDMSANGVKFFVCGQSLIARGVDPSEVTEEVSVATAALTVLTTYQLKGFAFLRF